MNWTATSCRPVLERGCMAFPMTPSQIYLFFSSGTLFRIQAYNEWLSGERVAEPVLHHLRLEFKNLRFLLELFQDHLTSKGYRLLMNCRRLQDTLGVLHDDTIMTGRLNKLIHQLKNSSQRQGNAASEREILSDFLHILSLERRKQFIHFRKYYSSFNQIAQGGEVT